MSEFERTFWHAYVFAAEPGTSERQRRVRAYLRWHRQRHSGP